MGHRKKHAPKRGSLAYLPRGRAAHSIGRIRFWPKVEKGPVLLGFAGYKAGMTYTLIIEDKQRSPNFGKEVVYPVTVIDAPPMIVCTLRAYTKVGARLSTLNEAWASSLSKDLERIKGVPSKAQPNEKLNRMKKDIKKITEFRVLAATQPRFSGVPKKKPDLMEIKIGGASIGEQFEYGRKNLGELVQVEDVFKDGQFVDAISVTKGKGWQGVVKRWGVRILQHKANKTKRGIATLGPWRPPRVLYTVPRSGQMGYHQRTEFNKRVLKIGKDSNEITPKGGFLRYGSVRSTYLILKGSISGPTKRLIRLRCPARPPKAITANPPQITYISLGSAQGV